MTGAAQKLIPEAHRLEGALTIGLRIIGGEALSQCGEFRPDRGRSHTRLEARDGGESRASQQLAEGEAVVVHGRSDA